MNNCVCGWCQVEFGGSLHSAQAVIRRQAIHKEFKEHNVLGIKYQEPIEEIVDVREV